MKIIFFRRENCVVTEHPPTPIFFGGGGGGRGRDHMVVGFTNTCVQSVPIITKVVSSNPVARCTHATLCAKVCQ